jgi:uncharacterized protein (DUF1697 family)
MLLFVALLRGINVAGHFVKKEKLQEAFNSLGFKNVSTFKQSGNVIFETAANNPEGLKNKIEAKLRSMLGYDVTVLLRTMEQLKDIVDLKPFEGQNREGSSFLVTILPAAVDKFPFQLPMTIPKSTAQVISARAAEIFIVTHGSGEGALPNPFIESKLKLKATTRNMNVIAEIVKRYG